MPQRRSPRTLRDVSHLFLSGSESAGTRGIPRSEAVIWIAAVGASANRAHLAAGTAAACVGQGMCASVMEVGASQPTIGYYFGMEPREYLAPAVDLSTLVSGVWEDRVRYCFSAKLSSLARYQGTALRPDMAHAIVVAFSAPPAGAFSRFVPALRVAAAAVGDHRGPGAPLPDCIIIAADRRHTVQARALLSDLRETVPHAMFLFAASGIDRARVVEADDSLHLPAALRESWARRMPPRDRFFDELVTGVFQMLSLRRRKAIGDAANE
jgi:hypothetical protein